MTEGLLRVRLVTGSDDPAGDPETAFLARTLQASGWEGDIATWSDPSARVAPLERALRRRAMTW